MTEAFTENITIADFEKLEPLVCQAEWLIDGTHIQQCINAAEYSAFAHDEVSCCYADNNKDEHILLCGECKAAAEQLQFGECGHKLIISIYPL